MTLNREKYTNAILYYLHHCNSATLGATKLNKLMYYLDFISYRDRAKSVTGDSYVHLQYGPVPSDLEDKILPDMKADHLLVIEKVKYKDGFVSNFIPRVSCDVDVFDAYEKDLLIKICNEFKTMKTDDIVAQTHAEAPWYYSEMYDKIDFENANDIEYFLAPA